MPQPHLPARLNACAARHRSLCLSIGGTASIVGAAALEWPSFSDSPVPAGINVVVTVALILTGVLLNGEDALGSVSGGLIIGGLLWALTWTAAWESGPSAVISSFAYTHFWICLGWGVLRYPNGRVQSNAERLLLIAATALIPVANLGLIAISEPSWFGYSGDIWWYGDPIDKGTFDAIVWVLDSSTIVLAVGFFLVIRARLRRSSALDRRIFGPVAVALLIAYSLAAGINLFVYNPSGARVPVAFVLVALALLAIPAAFAAAGVRRQLARAHIAQLLAGLATPPTPGAVRDVLRTALHDPSAEIYLWIPEERRHIDGDGAAVIPPQPTPESGQLVVPVATSAGAPLAMVSAASSLERNRDLVEVALQASAIALENARLHATVTAQLEAVRASRTRLVEAGTRERRRLERDLHDGAQQQLLALATRLGLARAKATDQETISAIEAAREDLHRALQELRSLARGIHPAVLSQAGLGPALEVVTASLPLDVDLDVPSTRFEPGLEACAYYTICEALTNTVKHAAATRALVCVRHDDGIIHIEVIDDGKGGATVETDGGLAGLTDRLRALDGDLTISSPPGGGTRLAARIPC